MDGANEHSDPSSSSTIRSDAGLSEKDDLFGVSDICF